MGDQGGGALGESVQELGGEGDFVVGTGGVCQGDGEGEAGLGDGLFPDVAVLFGLGVWYFAGGQYAVEFFAGYITEYSLSVDNLFLFVIIMSTFGVPREHQHRALLWGIVIALILRGVFIAIGAASKLGLASRQQPPRPTSAGHRPRDAPAACTASGEPADPPLRGDARPHESLALSVAPREPASSPGNSSPS